MTKTMRAGVLRNINDINCEIVDVPQIKEDEVLIKVTCSGICGSDFERVFKTGTWKFPTILGHEFGGEIVEIGSQVKGLNVGDKAVVNPMIPCGECEYCRMQKYNLCESYDYVGSRSDGGFSEYRNVKYTNVYKVPQELTHEQIASIDPAAIALHAIVKGGVKIGDKVAIFGSGPIGHYVAQWAKIVGASTVIAIDIVDQKLEISKELGADYIINSMNCDDVVKKVYELTENEGVDVAFETAGSNITAEQCLKSCKKQGTTVFLGTPHSDVTLKNDVFESILRRELRTVGSWCYHFAPPIDEWKVTIQHFAKGNIKTAPLITHKFKIEDVDKAFDLVRDKKEFFNKILIYSGENEV